MLDDLLKIGAIYRRIEESCFRAVAVRVVAAATDSANRTAFTCIAEAVPSKLASRNRWLCNESIDVVIENVESRIGGSVEG